MSRRTTLLALATTALTLSMVAGATPLPADSDSAYIGCFSTSSPLFPGSLDSPDVHVVTRVSALADCVDICSGTPGYSYAFWREKSHTCWCAPETAEMLPYIEALDEKGSCEETTAAGVALNQHWQHTGCFAYPSPQGDLITPPLSDSALSPSECLSFCGSQSASYTLWTPYPGSSIESCMCSDTPLRAADSSLSTGSTLAGSGSGSGRVVPCSAGTTFSWKYTPPPPHKEGKQVAFVAAQNSKRGWKKSPVIAPEGGMRGRGSGSGSGSGSGTEGDAGGRETLAMRVGRQKVDMRKWFKEQKAARRRAV